MKKRTVGILVTVLSILLCCLPGLALAAFGAFGFIGMATSQSQEAADPMLSTPIILGSMLCLGLLLMVLPLAFAVWTWRQKPEEEPGVQVVYASTTPAGVKSPGQKDEPGE